MVDTDNAKSKREFKKLSKCMGDRLDKEKGRSIEELGAPDFKRNHSTDMIRQRAEEKERSREASQNAKPGTIKRMQFTFSVDQPFPPVIIPVNKPDLKPSPEFSKRPRNAARFSATHDADDMLVVDDEAHDTTHELKEQDQPLTQRGRKPDPPATDAQGSVQSPSLRFPSLFSNDFGPSALLYPTPTATNRTNYGEGLNPSASMSPEDAFNVMRPTIELPLDELLNNVDSADSPHWTTYNNLNHNIPALLSSISQSQLFQQQQAEAQTQDVIMQSAVSVPSHGSKSSTSASSSSHYSDDEHSNDSSDDSSDMDLAPAPAFMKPPVLRRVQQSPKETLPTTIAPSKVNPLDLRASTPVGRPALTVRTQVSAASRSSGPSATATSVNPAALRASSSSASNTHTGPGGAKAECSNCGATHTPLWRRGLNDELNCNACGLYCKLHKRPRPKNMRSAHGEGRSQTAPRQETVDVMAQCHNCHTTATPLWRKDDEGKTVCNACGLYYKLHGSARPISMKSDVIRKRSRHDARRTTNSGVSETPSASPGVSRRPSPTRDQSPTLAPDSTTNVNTTGLNYEYADVQNDLLALAHDSNHALAFSMFPGMFPGPYHPDSMPNSSFTFSDQLPFAAGDMSDLDNGAMSPRSNKRRRMSNDSASEPPSSAVSYSSYTDGYTSASSTTSHSARSSMDFNFAFQTAGNGGSNPFGPLRGTGGSAFWHPPTKNQATDSPLPGVHPPMLPPVGQEDSPMDYLHPPMLPQDEDSLFSTYLHPPMSLPDGSDAGSAGHMNGNGNGNGQQHAQTPMFSDFGSGVHADGYDAHMRMY
ncbi:hypothetical protein HGRIS_006791 [Hohenbuehelia grisea]